MSNEYTCVRGINDRVFWFDPNGTLISEKNVPELVLKKYGWGDSCEPSRRLFKKLYPSERGVGQHGCRKSNIPSHVRGKLTCPEGRILYKTPIGGHDCCKKKPSKKPSQSRRVPFGGLKLPLRGRPCKVPPGPVGCPDHFKLYQSKLTGVNCCRKMPSGSDRPVGRPARSLYEWQQFCKKLGISIHMSDGKLKTIEQMRRSCQPSKAKKVSGKRTSGKRVSGKKTSGRRRGRPARGEYKILE